jgi:hypothetical protein
MDDIDSIVLVDPLVHLRHNNLVIIQIAKGRIGDLRSSSRDLSQRKFVTFVELGTCVNDFPQSADQCLEAEGGTYVLLPPGSTHGTSIRRWHARW